MAPLPRAGYVVSAPGSPIVVGFWRRFFADLVDALALGGLGWAIGYPLRYPLSDLGASAVWIGLLISLAYASVLQTRMGDGQTLGKRALGIQVLRRDGTFLSFGRSLARYLVVSFVFYNGMYGAIFRLVSPRVAEVLGMAFLLIVFVAFFGCFLMVPLHPLKRGLHDLVSDSVVVYKGQYERRALDALENPARAKQVLGLMGLLAAMLLGVCAWTFQGAKKAHNLDRLTALQRELDKDYQVRSVNDSTVNGKNRTLTVQVWLPLRRYEDNVERERVRADVLSRTRETLPGIGDFQVVNVRLVSGFGLGIANMNQGS